jgi:hypothetical protein
MPTTKHLPITAPVADVLRTSRIVEDLDHGGYLLTLPEISDRKRHLEVSKTLALGGGILRKKLNGYAFSTDPRTVFAAAFHPEAAGDEPLSEASEPADRPLREPNMAELTPTNTPKTPADALARATLVIQRRTYSRPLPIAEQPEMFEVRCQKSPDDPGRVILSYQQAIKAEQGRAWLMNGHDLCRHCKNRFRGHAKGGA